MRKLLPNKIRLIRLPRTTFALSIFLSVIFLLGCAPTYQNESRQNPADSSTSDNLPELDDETINERISNAFVRKVPIESGNGETINWTFNQDEPKEIRIIEKQIEGNRATVVLDIKTESATYARERRSLAGQIRTYWELQTSLILRKWEIVRTENISMKYKNLPKLPAQNSNQQ